MLPQHVLVALVAAVSAVPLNINLGAYSPALVVGDGEISLGSGEEASNLMQTLASGAAGGGEGGRRQGQQPEQRPQQGQPGQEQQREGQEGQQQQEGEQGAENKEAANEGRAVSTLNLRSLGKRSPSPAPESETVNAMQDAVQWIKRDIAGFREALTYAREAQKEQPKVELGTGEAGSGVGVVVHPGTDVAANSAANGAPPAGGERRQKRAEVVAEESEAPKMTLVAITEV